MALDDDIAAALPRSPPPAPARRTAAIEAAMRRFDGVDDPAPAPIHTECPAPWWTRLGRPQAGALVSIALVAVIGLPVAWISLSQPLGSGGGSASRAPVTQDQAMNHEDVASNDLADGTVAANAAAPTLASNDAQASPAAQAPNARPADATPVELARADTLPPAPAPAFAPPAPAPPPPPAIGMIAEKAEAPRASRPEPPAQLAGRSRQDVVVSGSRLRSRPPTVIPGPPPPDAASDRRAYAEEMEDSSIVVTGTKRSTRASARGDWNACTVNDPARSLSGCRRLVDPAAKGANGRAAAQVADGLALAWKGDEDGAIAAFDRAIELSPRSAIAYLNRGLAHRRNGDDDRALADLDRAVRYAPGSARGYYQRSLLLRDRGQDRRADADATRAVELDRRYADLFE